MAHDVFISCAHPDKPVGDAICATLEANAFRCWIAPRDIMPGADWGASIINAIGAAKVMVLVFSSQANVSVHIKREVERAVNAGLPIIPVRIEDEVPKGALEYFLSTPHWLDAFTGEMAEHLEQLVKITRILLGRDADSPPVAVPHKPEPLKAPVPIPPAPEPPPPRPPVADEVVVPLRAPEPANPGAAPAQITADARIQEAVDQLLLKGPVEIVVKAAAAALNGGMAPIVAAKRLAMGVAARAYGDLFLLPARIPQGSSFWYTPGGIELLRLIGGKELYLLCHKYNAKLGGLMTEQNYLIVFESGICWKAGKTAANVASFRSDVCRCAIAEARYLLLGNTFVEFSPDQALLLGKLLPVLHWIAQRQGA